MMDYRYNEEMSYRSLHDLNIGLATLRKFCPHLVPVGVLYIGPFRSYVLALRNPNTIESGYSILNPKRDPYLLRKDGRFIRRRKS
jgi:hypothetical protein